jgi:hypothetical protein
MMVVQRHDDIFPKTSACRREKEEGQVVGKWKTKAGSRGVENRKLEQTFHGHVRHFPRQIGDLQLKNEV